MIDRREFLQLSSALFAAPLLPQRPTHPHAALYLYTRPRFRPRHAALVQQALQRRAGAHTSGWQTRDGRPVIAIGPVNASVNFWKRTGEIGKDIGRAWPFVAVLEYDGAGQPEAFVDWFRRPRNSNSDDGWLLDPGVGYVDHINAEVVTGLDPQWCYLAVPDTPTGSHVGDSEFLIRARVRWADGRAARLGWWIWFEAPKARRTDDWFVEQTPLCDWRVAKSLPKLGAVDVGGLDDPERHLAVWGTDRVFTLPVMPAGLTPGRGRS